MAAAAATPTTASETRSDLRPATSAATAATPATADSQMKSRPVFDESRSPSETPSVALAARSMAAAPSTARTAPIHSTARRAGTMPPNAQRPTTVEAKRSARPAYSATLPATLAKDGEGVAGAGTLGSSPPGGTPTPKPNAPAVEWPSASETTRQVTV